MSEFDANNFIVLKRRLHPVDIATLVEKAYEHGFSKGLEAAAETRQATLRDNLRLRAALAKTTEACREADSYAGLMDMESVQVILGEVLSDPDAQATLAERERTQSVVEAAKHWAQSFRDPSFHTRPLDTQILLIAVDAYNAGKETE